MKKIFSSLLSVIATGLLLTSCLSTDGSSSSRIESLTYGGDDCFNYVIDLSTGETFVTTAPNYSIEMDVFNLTASMSISNLQIVPGQSLTFKLEDLKVDTASDTYSYRISGSNLAPATNSTMYSFDNLAFTVGNRYMTVGGSTAFLPVYNMNFTVTTGGKSYSVVVIPTTVYLVGKLSTEPQDSEAAAQEDAVYRTDIGVYAFKLNVTSKTAQFYFFDAKLRDDMVAANFWVDALPFTVNATSISIQGVAGQDYPVKSAANTEIKDCSVTDLRVTTIIPSGNTYIDFNANLSGIQASLPPFTATGTAAYYQTEK